MYQLQYKPFGEKAILIEWPATISELILDDILIFKSKIIAQKKSCIADIIVGYHSLTIVFNSHFINYTDELSILKSIYNSDIKRAKKFHHLWEIPVCYDDEFGLDLEEISKKKNLSKEAIIQLHSQPIYTIFFIGFLPGFLYLGGLDSQLFMDRKSNPRLQIDQGSVGIGGKQTGIYPLNSPGGWNIIGKTPLLFFDAESEKPCFATSKDFIKFIPISKEEFYEIQGKVHNKSYQISKKKNP